MLDIIKKTALQVVTDALVPALSPDRWTILQVQPNVSAFGLVFGRRISNKLGIVAMLLLQEDNSFLPLLVPVEGELPVFDEAVVRERFVFARKLGYAARGHAFTPSPVFPARCHLCAEMVLPHQQDALRVTIERTLGTLEVVVNFVEGTTKVADIKVRPQPTAEPILNPMPGDATPRQVVKKEAYRPLSDKERSVLKSIPRLEGVEGVL